MKCHEKARFKTKAKARKYQGIHNQTQTDGIKMHVYKCPYCKYYHLSKFRKPLIYNEELERPVFTDKRDAELARRLLKEKGNKYIRIYTKDKYYYLSNPRNETTNNKNTRLEESGVQPPQDK